MMVSSLQPRGVAAEALATDIPSARLGRALFAFTENLADDAHHRFVLTRHSWRSPTMRISILTGTRFTNPRLEPNDDDVR